MTVQLLDKPFDPWQELANFEKNLRPGSVGAAATFVGTMRDFNEGQNVTGMLLEHYPGMTEKQLDSIVERAGQQWSIDEALIVHRIGQISPGESIVLCAIWSAHRAAAFEACRFLMEALKSEATFWKKETLSDDSSRWVEKNTPGYST